MTMLNKYSRRVLVLLVVLVLSLPFVCSTRIGWSDFDWYIKDAPPTGPPSFKARTTGYWLALEEDWPSWYTGAKMPGSNMCTIPASQRGFYEDVKCEGTGFTNEGKLIIYSKIQTTKEASEPFMYTPEEVLSKKNLVKAVRPKRTIAVNPDKGTSCYIPRNSRVYIKFPDPSSPFTGWYVAQDTGGGFHGKCAIDIFIGLGKQTGANPTVSKTDESQWPEVWVFPPDSSDDLWADNVFTYMLGAPSTGKMPGEGGVPASATAPKPVEGSTTPGYMPTHPYFTVPYSVNPSFSVSIPYDFSIYTAIPIQLKKLERCKDDMDCILGNVSAIEAENQAYDWIVSQGGNVLSKDKQNNSELPAWESFCEKPAKHALNSLAEALDTCSSSVDSDCVCTYQLPIVTSDDLNRWYGRALSAGLMLIPGVGPILGIASFAATELSSVKAWEERIFTFSKGSSGLAISGEGTQVVKSAKFKEVAQDMRGASSNVLKYKSSQAGKSLDIYKDKSGNMSIYLEGSAPKSRKCEVHSRMVKFCIVQNDTFMAYNEQSNRMGVQQLVLKFAYLFRSEVTDVKNFEVYDAVMSSNTSLLVWDPMEGVDVSAYNIYYSENLAMEANLRGIAPKALDPDMLSQLTQISLEVASKQDVFVSLASLQNPVCVVDKNTCQLKYALTTATEGESTALEKGRLYYSAVDRKFFIFLPGINNGQQYFFGITAIDDKTGEESPSFTSPAQGKRQDSVDDVPPGLATVNSAVISGTDVIFTISPVTYSIDGSFLDTSEIQNFRIYCFVSLASDTYALSSKESLFASGISAFTDSVQFSRPLADFTQYNCGEGQNVKFVVAGVKKVKGIDVDYKGNVTSSSFSASEVALPVS